MRYFYIFIKYIPSLHFNLDNPISLDKHLKIKISIFMQDVAFYNVLSS